MYDFLITSRGVTLAKMIKLDKLVLLCVQQETPLGSREEKNVNEIIKKDNYN